MTRGKRKISLHVGASLAFALLIMAVAATGAMASETVIVDYTFDAPTVKSIVRGHDQYDRVTMEGAANCGLPGQPSLPSERPRRSAKQTAKAS